MRWHSAQKDDRRQRSALFFRGRFLIKPLPVAGNTGTSIVYVESTDLSKPVSDYETSCVYQYRTSYNNKKCIKT